MHLHKWSPTDLTPDTDLNGVQAVASIVIFLNSFNSNATVNGISNESVNNVFVIFPGKLLKENII